MNEDRTQVAEIGGKGHGPRALLPPGLTKRDETFAGQLIDFDRTKFGLELFKREAFAPANQLTHLGKIQSVELNQMGDRLWLGWRRGGHDLPSIGTVFLLTDPGIGVGFQPECL